MKIFITSNTQFGYKGITKTQFSYFTEKIIPFLKDKYRSGDIFIHGGNIFNNKRSVNMDIINDVMNIFEEISKILPIYIIKSPNDELASLLLKRIKNVNIVDDKKEIDNILLLSYKEDINNVDDNQIIIYNNDYMENPDLYKKVLKNFDISICTHYEDKEIEDDNIINIGSPYQLNKTHTNKKGFLVIDSVKKKFKLITNNYSPKFIKLNLEKIEDLENLRISSKDFIDVKVNESILTKKENLNKLNLAINKYNFSNISYIKNKENNDPQIKIDSHSFNIKEIIHNYINENNIDLSEELETVYKIHKEKL